MEVNNKLEKVSSQLLLETKGDLEKALSSHKFHTVIALLKVLKKTLITRELLADTLIGKTLTSCSKAQAPKEHGDLEGEASQVREISAEILTEWKKINKVEKQKAQVPEYKEETKLQKEVVKSAASDIDTTVSSTVIFWKAGDMFVPPSLKLEETNKFRRTIQEKLIQILQTPLTSEDDPFPEPYEEDMQILAANLAVEVERQLYINFKDEKSYKDRVRSILFNLKDRKNPFLRLRVLEGQMVPDFLATADSKDLASDQKKLEREEAQKQHMQARRSDFLFEELKKKCTGGFFTCKKCKSKKTSYYQ